MDYQNLIISLLKDISFVSNLAIINNTAVNMPVHIDRSPFNEFVRCIIS